MRIFKHSQGFLVSFGFDPNMRMQTPRRICWSDPMSNCVWIAADDNQAGYIDMPFTVNPEFIREIGGRILAYQSGKCIEMVLDGTPLVWRIITLQSDVQPISEVA